VRGCQVFDPWPRREAGVVRIVAALADDVTGWLELAREVEALFGPMVDNPEFSSFVTRNIARGTAFVARNDRPGSPLKGAIAVRMASAPRYEISWLAVRSHSRGAGVGTALVAAALRSCLETPATVTVVTFGRDHPGRRAIRFYEQLGFNVTGPAADGPDGSSRLELRLTLDEMPAWITNRPTRHL
jgi:ribosomal protein S18 acetylase RimI-like enzyme